MTTPDLSALEKMAREATQGEWSYDHPLHNEIIGGEIEQWQDDYWSIENDDCKVVATVSTEQEADATFIAAANPQTILAMIAEIRRLRECVDRFDKQLCRYPEDFCQNCKEPTMSSEASNKGENVNRKVQLADKYASDGMYHGEDRAIAHCGFVAGWDAAVSDGHTQPCAFKDTCTEGFGEQVAAITKERDEWKATAQLEARKRDQYVKERDEARAELEKARAVVAAARKHLEAWKPFMDTEFELSNALAALNDAAKEGGK